jgi:hypothetical protein
VAYCFFIRNAGFSSSFNLRFFENERVMAQEKDLVLIYQEDKPLTYARIEAISPDSKPDWYHVDLLLLQFPAQPFTMILRNAYINGGEFTMNGQRMRLEMVESPFSDRTAPGDSDESGGGTGGETDAGPSAESAKESTGGKVISLANRKKD